MYWYVLFVKTGYEQKIKNEIYKFWKLENSKPFVPMYEARFKRGGRVYPEIRRMTPGYVFVESEMPGLAFYFATQKLIWQSKNTLKLMRYGDTADDKNFEMKPEEYAAFMHLCNEEHCVEMSKGFIEGDLVYIIEGPLKGMESRIKKVRAPKMEAVVEMQMFGQFVEIKIGLEIIRKI